MAALHVSYGELVRAATEAVRGLGFPFGQADDAAECFVWTEAVTGRGYRLLRLTDGIRPAAGWGRHVVLPHDEGAVIRLNGLPLLVLASRIADLATAIAGASGRAQIVAEGGAGGWVTPYIVNRLAGAGLNVVASWIADDASLETPSQVIAARGARAPGEVSLDVALLTKRGDIPFAHPQLQPAEPGNRLHISCGKPGSLSTVDGFVAERPDAGRWHNLVPAPRLRHMIAQGASVPAESHAHLLSLCSRLRVPASDRSRQQAG